MKNQSNSQQKKNVTSSIGKHLETQSLSGEEIDVDICQNNEVNHADRKTELCKIHQNEEFATASSFDKYDGISSVPNQDEAILKEVG